MQESKGHQSYLSVISIVSHIRINELMTGMTVQGSKAFGPKIANAVRLQLFRMENNAFGNDLGNTTVIY